MDKTSDDSTKRETPYKDAEHQTLSYLKLWGLLFMAIARGEMKTLENCPFEDDIDCVRHRIKVEYDTAINNLYMESCQRTSRTLPILSSSKDYHKILCSLKESATVVLEYFNKAKPYFGNHPNAVKYYDIVAKNCKIIVDLLNYKRDKSQFDGELWEGLQYFSHLDMKPWYIIVNGTCLEHTDYDTFSHALNYIGYDGEINWLEECEEEDADYIDDDGNAYIIRGKDYSECRIVPKEGFAIAMYAFQILLLSKKVEHYLYPGPEFTGSLEKPESWAERFEIRIDWTRNYTLIEDDWKRAYFNGSKIEDDIISGVLSTEKFVLEQLCQRPTFEDIISPKGLDYIIGNGSLSDYSYSQLLYIRKNEKVLSQIHLLLIKETDYIYSSLGKILDHFESKRYAEYLRNITSPEEYSTKAELANSIDTIFNETETLDSKSVAEILYWLAGLKCVNLRQQPIIHSEMVEQYLQNVAIQDEKLLLLVNRAIQDKGLMTNNINNAKISELCIKLHQEGFIDSDCNIAPRNPAGKGKQYKTIELTSYLVREEIVKPQNGWRKAIEQIKYEVVPANFRDERTGRFNNSIYNLGSNYDMEFINRINWNMLDGVFKVDGKALSGDELKNKFSQKNAKRTEIILRIIKKYEGLIPKM